MCFIRASCLCLEFLILRLQHAATFAAVVYSGMYPDTQSGVSLINALVSSV